MECKFLKKLDDNTKKLKWYDIPATKIAVFSGTLFLAKYFPVLMALDWYWYVLIAIVASISPMYSFCGKSKKKAKRFPITYKKSKKRK